MYCAAQRLQRKELTEDRMKQIWKPALAVTIALVAGFTPPRAFAAPGIGEDLYKARCAPCHGPDGAGATAMGKALKLRDLGSRDVQKQPDDELNQITTNGKGRMPAFDGKL